MTKIKLNSLADLKKWVNKLPDSELSKPLCYKSDDYHLSGRVQEIIKSPADLLYAGDDDPAPIYTRTQLKGYGYSKTEIEEMDVEIPKGSYILNI